MIDEAPQLSRPNFFVTPFNINNATARNKITVMNGKTSHYCSNVYEFSKSLIALLDAVTGGT